MRRTRTDARPGAPAPPGAAGRWPRGGLGRALLLAAGLWAAGGAAAAGEGPGDGILAVASIKPVHALVAAVTEGVAVPALLVERAGSPHTHALRPSEARLLERADVIFWVGEELETFLARPLAALGTGARAVSLADAPGLTRLALRKAGVRREPPFRTLPWDPRAERRAHDWPVHASVDPHLWLDPANAAAMVAAITEALGEVDPANKARYDDNGARTRARIEALDAELEALLAPLRGEPYVVFHDAYQYLERRYGLNAVAAVTVNPERPPGARRLAEIKEVMRETGVRCVFTVPPFEPALMRALTAGTRARAAPLDPLGARIPPGPGFYFALMRALADGLRDCLGEGLPG